MESDNRKTLLCLGLSTLALVGFVFWHFPPGMATDPENGVLLGAAADVSRSRMAWAVARTSAGLLALPVGYAALGRPSAGRLWVLWALIVAGWLFAGDWYPNVD